MFKIESNYITVDQTFAAEDEAREWAVDQMQQYIEDFVEEFVTFETIRIADDPGAFIEAVRDGEIDNYDIANDLKDYVDQVRFNENVQLDRIRGLSARVSELQDQLEQLRRDNHEAA